MQSQPQYSYKKDSYKRKRVYPVILMIILVSLEGDIFHDVCWIDLIVSQMISLVATNNSLEHTKIS